MWLRYHQVVIPWPVVLVARDRVPLAPENRVVTMQATWTEARLEALTARYLDLCDGTPHDELMGMAAREVGGRLSDAISYLRARNLRGE